MPVASALDYHRPVRRTLVSASIAIAACAAPTPPAPPAAPTRVVCSAPPSAEPDPPARAPLDGVIALPSAPVRLAMFDAVVSEMLRLDGDGLVFRERRREPFAATVAKLRVEAERASSLTGLGRVFKRLDATYPNLHTRVHLRRELDAVKSEGRVAWPVVVRQESVDHGAPPVYRVASVTAPGEGVPAVGDAIVAVNGRPVAAWADENELFCEYPLREQCDADLFEAVRRELLSWERAEPLTFRVEHAGATRDWVVPVTLDQKPPWPKKRELPCGVGPDRYPGFTLAYRGAHACLFESKKHPDTALLRIDSFLYEDDPVSWLGAEAELLFFNAWQRRAGSVKTLVVDVMGNHGGDAPMGYYQLLATAPFQEQYVRFKRIAEFERPDIVEELFWHDGGKEKWLAALREDGSLAATPTGAFLPPIPQFCADKTRDCRDARWTPRDHAFRGDVRVLVDQDCVSSCVGFVWQMKSLFGDRARLYGTPDSGDSTYSRLAVLVSPTASGEVLVELGPRKRAHSPAAPEPWVRQLVSVTESTDAAGHVVSGAPQPLAAWVPRRWDDTDDRFAARALAAALARPR